MKKVYISGPMTGYEKFNFPAFDRAKHELTQQGFQCFSPADHDRELLGKPKDWVPEDTDSEGPWLRWALPNAPTLRRMLKEDLVWIADEGDAIYMLKGWEKSSGAKIEHALAVVLGQETIYEA